MSRWSAGKRAGNYAGAPTWAPVGPMNILTEILPLPHNCRGDFYRADRSVQSVCKRRGHEGRSAPSRWRGRRPPQRKRIAATTGDLRSAGRVTSCDRCGAGLGLEEGEARNVAEVPGVQRPEHCAARARTCGHAEVELALARARHQPIQLRRQGSLTRAERQSLGRRQQRLLMQDLHLASWSAQPLVQHEARDPDALALSEDSPQHRRGAPRSGQCVDEYRGVEMDQRGRVGLRRRPQRRRDARTSRSSTSTSATVRVGGSWTMRSTIASIRARSSSLSLVERASYSRTASRTT